MVESTASPPINLDLLRDFTILTIKYKEDIPALMALYVSDPEKLGQLLMQHKDIVFDAMMKADKEK